MTTIDKAIYQQPIPPSKPSNTNTLFLKKVWLPILVIVVLAIGAVIWTLHSQQMLPPIPFLTNNSWNAEKATYLARRVYLNPTMDDIKTLSNASSAQDAVTTIFAPISQTEEQQYQQGLQNLIQNKATFKNDTIYEDTLYAYQLVHDPDRVKRKLYYLWENTFSVDAPEKGKMITLDDAKALHQMLYDNAFGNYIQLVKNVENNYAMAQYLDLSQSSGKNPNENFARELMQLFLIGPYTPLDHNRSTLNYTDQDVSSLAYILTGFTSNKGNHTIYFNNKRHYVGSKSLFGQKYNDPQAAIDFIIQQKKTQAGEFLANKLLHYYVTDTPSDQDITTFSNIIIQNNFEILPSLKWLFSSALMYEPTYMAQDRYKTPMELIASYYSLLFGRNDYSVIPNAPELTDLDFRPYNPGSIFGRDGFNSNILFYSGTIINRWIADTDRLIHTVPAKNIPALANTLIPNPSTIHSPTDLINEISQELYLGNTLAQPVQDSLKNYLTTNDAGNTIPFAITNSQYVRTKLSGLLSFMLVQPEFLAQSGNLQAISLPPITQVNGGTNSKLIIVRVRGGWDFQGIWANTNDPAYAANRKQMALNATNATSLGNGYMLSNAASSLLPLIQSKDAHLISSVGLPNHSRAHDIAGLEMETGDNQNQEGILGQLAQALPSTNLITFSNTPPIMTKGAQSLQIGSSSLTLYQIGKKKTAYTKNVTVREDSLKQIFTGRLFPQPLAIYYTQALLLDKLANEDIAQGGKGTPGGTNVTQTPFLEKLIGDNIGNTYYLYADNSYDHHAHEDVLLGKEDKRLFDTFTSFYNDEKSKTKLTIVFFSEFGRTDKINGSNGTDHGQGGGMIILSNVLHMPTMVGTITPSTDTHNWTNVQVDERDTWSSIFTSLYGLPQDKLFGRSTPLTNYPIGIQ